MGISYIYPMVSIGCIFFKCICYEYVLHYGILVLRNRLRCRIYPTHTWWVYLGKRCTHTTLILTWGGAEGMLILGTPHYKGKNRVLPNVKNNLGWDTHWVLSFF
jgi:hypothetical protein